MPWLSAICCVCFSEKVLVVWQSHPEPYFHNRLTWQILPRIKTVMTHLLLIMILIKCFYMNQQHQVEDKGPFSGLTLLVLKVLEVIQVLPMCAKLLFWHLLRCCITMIHIILTDSVLCCLGVLCPYLYMAPCLLPDIFLTAKY